MWEEVHGMDSRGSACWGTRRRRPKEARFCYSSKTSVGHHRDPLPEYIDPELVKLIAQNAPLELDVFARPLHRSSSKQQAESNDVLRGAVKGDGRRPLAVEALLSSVIERNEHWAASKGSQESRHSCPERFWSDCYEEDEGVCGAKTVKRKRPKSLDTYRTPIVYTPHPCAVNIRAVDNNGSRQLRAVSPDNGVASPGSSDYGSNCVEDECLPSIKPDSFRPCTPPPKPAPGTDPQMMNAKPWRHGMRKRSADRKLPESARPERSAEVDSQRSSEVKKYMETKAITRRKAQHQLKAEAEAVLAARKEQQRKLDLHRQAMLKSQVGRGKSREHTPRPAWISDNTIFGEPARPWSSSSSSEQSIFLPPPVTPPKLEPESLDLYTTRFQYAERQSPAPGCPGSQVRNTQSGDKRRSKKLKGCSREVQRQLKYDRKSKIGKAFVYIDAELAELANPPVIRKARWKAKTKPVRRRLSSEKVLQHQEMTELRLASFSQRSGDLEVYKRRLRKQFVHDGISTCRPAKATRAQKYASTSLQRQSKCVQRAERCAPDFKDPRHFPSKLKRLKSTQRFIACEPKELTAKEIATMLNANRGPSDCESEVHTTGVDKVVTERMVLRTGQISPEREREMATDLQKCGGHLLGSPEKHMGIEDFDLNWFEPSLASREKLLTDGDVSEKDAGDPWGSSLKSLINKEAPVQVIDLTERKTRSSPRMGGGKRDPTRPIRHERMLLLRNLADQLVKKVDAACARKCHVENSTGELSKSLSLDSHLDMRSKPSAYPIRTGSANEIELVKPELKFLHQPRPVHSDPFLQVAEDYQEDESRGPQLQLIRQAKQFNFLHSGELTELEQGGCGLPSAPEDEMEIMTNLGMINPQRAVVGRVTEYITPPPAVSEISTKLDWNATVKDMDITCNSPSSSFSPTSPSTYSSSPVILPTSTKYHVGRIRQIKALTKEEQTRKSKKQNGTLPVEDRHSIINLYAEHWKLKGKETVATSVYTHNTESDVEDKSIPTTRAPRREIAASELNAACPSVPSCQTDRHFKVLENKGVQTVQSPHCCHNQRRSPEFEAKDLDCPSKQNIHHHCESLQDTGCEAGQSVATPSTDHTKSQINARKLPGHVKPDMILVEIGDLTLCQSPTSVHLRLDRHQDNGEDNKWRECRVVNDSHPSKMEDLTTTSSGTCWGSEEDIGSEVIKSMASPLKITYSQQSHSGTLAHGVFTDDDRIVVEFHRVNGKGLGMPMMQRTTSTVSPESLKEAIPEVMRSPAVSIVVGNAESEIATRSLNGSTAGKDLKEMHILGPFQGNGVLKLVSQEDTRLSDMQGRAKLGAVEESLLDQTWNYNETNVRTNMGGEDNLKDHSEEQEMSKVLGIGTLSGKLSDPLMDEEFDRDMQDSLVLHKQRARRNVECLRMKSLSNCREAMVLDGDTGSPHVNISAHKTGWFLTSMKDSELDPLIDVQDFEERQLKLRRNQLEAELQRLDVQIRKTRARLQQSCCVIDNQVESRSCDPSANRPHENTSNLHEISHTRKGPAKFMSTYKMHNNVHGVSSGVLLQETDASLLNPRSCGDLDSKNTCSNSCSDSFVSADMEMGLKITGTENLDVSCDPLFDRNNGTHFSGAQKSGIKEVQAIQTEDRSARSQNDIADMSRVWPNFTMIRTQDDLASEVSKNSMGRGPWRKHGRLPQESADDVTSGTRISNAGPPASILRHVVDVDGRGVPPFGKDLKTSAVAITNPHLGAIQAADTSEIDVTGSCGRFGRVHQKIAGKSTRGSIGQMPIQHSARTVEDQWTSHEAAICSPNSQDGGIDRQSPTTAEREKEDSSCASVRNQLNSDAQIFVNSRGREQKLGRETPSKVEVTTRSPELAYSLNRRRILPLQDQMVVVAVEVLECSMDDIRHDGSCTATVMSTLHGGIQTSGDNIGIEVLSRLGNISHRTVEEMAMEHKTRAHFQQCERPLTQANDQVETFEVGQVFTCTHDGKLIDETSSQVALQMLHGSVLASVNSPCGFISDETNWKSLSSPSHMDFSTIKQKLRNSKLAIEEPLLPVYSSSLTSAPVDHVGLPVTGLEADGPQVVINSYPPETKANKGMPCHNLAAAPSGSQSIKSATDPDHKLCDMGRFTISTSSLRDPPSLLAPLHCNPQRKACNPLKEIESAIPEEMENHESDIDEVLEVDIEAPSSLVNFEMTSLWKPNVPLSDSTSLPKSSGVLFGLPSSPSIAVFNAESTQSITTRLGSQIEHIHNNISNNCHNEGLMVGPFHRFIDTCRPSLVSPEHSLRLASPDSEVQSGTNGEPSHCARTDGKETSECPLTASTVEENFLDLVSIVKNYVCESRMSGSQLQSNITCADVVPLSTVELASRTAHSGDGDLQMLVNNQEIHLIEVSPESANIGYIGSSVMAGKSGHLMEHPDINFSATSYGKRTGCETHDFPERSHHPVATMSSSHLQSDNSKTVEVLHLGADAEAIRKGGHVPFSEGLSVTTSSLEEKVNREKYCLSGYVSGVHIEPDHAGSIECSTSGAYAGFTGGSGAMMKTTSPAEQSDPGNFFSLDVGNIKVVQPKSLDVGNFSSHLMGVVQAIDVHLPTDTTEEVEVDSGLTFVEKQEKTCLIVDEINNFPKQDADRSERRENVAKILDVLDGGLSQSDNALLGQKPCRSAGATSAEVLSQKKSAITVYPGLELVASASHSRGPINNTVVSHSERADTHSLNQLPIEKQISEIGSADIVNSLYRDESNRGSCTSTANPEVKPATGFILADSGSESSEIPGSICYQQPDQVKLLQSYKSETSRSRAPLLGTRQTVLDPESHARCQAQDEKGMKQLNHELEFLKIDAEYGRGCQTAALMSNSVYPSRLPPQVPFVKLASQKDILSGASIDCCSDLELDVEAGLQPSEKVVRDDTTRVAHELPIGEGLKVCSSNLANRMRMCPILYEKDKDESRCSETIEEDKSLDNKLISISTVSQEETLNSSHFTVHQDSCCFVAHLNGPMWVDGPPKNFKMKGTIGEDEKKFLTETLTGMLYNELLSEELSGLLEVERGASSENAIQQTTQTKNATKTWRPTLKRKSRKVFEFCAVLKHFLPTGWRSVSVKHKTGSFLDVEGLRPHPLSSATRMMRGTELTTLNLLGQYHQDGEPEPYLFQMKPANTQPLLLDWSEVHSYVQKTLELSHLILDPSPKNWFDVKKPVGEHIFGAVESQLWKTVGASEKCRQVDNKLLSDLINESLSKHFATVQCVPSFSIKTLPLPAGSDKVVKLITNDIVSYQILASEHRCDIDKVIAKDLKDEIWEDCSKLLQDVIDNLAHAILCDLIQGFVHEMVRRKIMVVLSI